jgi:hypothetical protein
MPALLVCIAQAAAADAAFAAAFAAQGDTGMVEILSVLREAAACGGNGADAGLLAKALRCVEALSKHSGMRGQQPAGRMIDVMRESIVGHQIETIKIIFIRFAHKKQAKSGSSITSIFLFSLKCLL